MSTSAATVRDGNETAESISYVYRALKVLEILAQGDATPDELAGALSVHKRTAQRLLDTMIAAGFVQSLPTAPQRYDLTAKVIAIAAVLRSRLNLADVSQSYVRRLRDLTAEFAHLDIPTEGRVVSLSHARSSHRLKAEPRPGQLGPMHASAVGKAMMAHLPAQFEAACDTGLERYTPNTICTRAALAAHLEQVRAQGYALDDEEIEPGQRCLAAPVFDDSGQVIAALGVSGPAQRINADTLPTLAAHVVATARELSQELGFYQSQSLDGWQQS